MRPDLPSMPEAPSAPGRPEAPGATSATAELAIPDWARWGALAIGVLLVLSFAVNTYLRSVIRARTAELQEQRNRLRAIFDHAPVELYVKDAEGRFVEVNRRFEQHFSVRSEEVAGKLPADVIGPVLGKPSRQHDLTVLTTGEVITREEQMMTGRGPRMMHTIKFPIFGEDGGIDGLGAVAIDMSAQQAARERAERAEQRLLDAVNVLPGAFALFDSDDRLVLCNDKFCEIYPNGKDIMVPGITFEEILREGLARRQYPEAVGREEDWLQGRLEARYGRGEAFEQQLLGDRWLTVLDSPTSDGGILSFRVDITALKRQQRALEGARQRAEAAARKLGEQTRKLEQVVRISGIGGWELDTDLDELSWDGTTRRILEVQPGYVPRLDRMLGFFTPDSRAVLEPALAAATDDLVPFDLKLELVTARMRKIWVRCVGQPVVEAGKVRRLTGVMQDITDQQTHEQALERSRLEAEKANVAKSQFLANMSHEIRTPMNGVTGMLALLLQSELTATQRKQAETAHASASGLMQILNDILDYSKLEANEMQIEKAPFDPREVIGEVTAMLGLRALEKGLDLRTDIEPDIPSALIGDPTRLRQVLVNLVGNAIKFTEEGHVTLRCERRGAMGRQLVFEVEDSGIGIAQSAQQTLFTRFAQVHANRSGDLGGTGLGLAISKQLVEAMGGRIAVESEPGRGSVFWFWVPLHLPQEPGPGGQGRGAPTGQTSADPVAEPAPQPGE